MKSQAFVLAHTTRNRHKAQIFGWLRERLAMGHYTNVSHGAAKLTERGAKKVRQMRRKLDRLNEKNAEKKYTNFLGLTPNVILSPINGEC